MLDFLSKFSIILLKGKIFMQIDNVSELGKLIKDTRKSQGLTQADLAISANVGVRFIVDLENGKETAQIGKILQVCQMLGLEIDIKG